MQSSQKVVQTSLIHVYSFVSSFHVFDILLFSRVFLWVFWKKIVNRDVMTNVMVVTTPMVSVIEYVNRAGRETIVNNVIYLHYTKSILT